MFWVLCHIASLPNKLDNIVLLILSRFRATSQKIFKENNRPNKSHTQDLVLRPNISLQSLRFALLITPGSLLKLVVNKESPGERDGKRNRQILQRK